MNGDAGVKEVLKDIIREHLDKAASSLFIDKSLGIIDESADNKESFMAAAVWISRRISLFIDKELAQTVYESLMGAIERIEVPQGMKRRYARVAFFRKVRVKHEGEYHDLDTENLSEGGMYIKTYAPFPAGSEIEISVPLEVGSRLDLRGVVLYERDPFGDTSRLPPGMAVEFRGIRTEEIEILQRFIQRVPLQASL